ncbi:MAG: Stp1/IreP family PP2C-type Ser/Thr phosphatase [Candidatus Accumulibacter sp.]|jgi:protein phosphatase|nr:Stp1/IreP family PP2C-type Ser/Thr phosphatase [Accumulibacter sp.]
MSEALEIVARTDPGKVRGHNEDAVFIDPARGLAILADGMGGYNAGEVASGIATSFLASALETSFFDPVDGVSEAGGRPSASDSFAESIRQANLAIYNAACSEPVYAGMGTTLVMALFFDNRITVAHIGDSRLYRLRDGRFTAMTRDHSLLQEQIDRGMISTEEARFARNKNLVTRALGVEPSVESEIHTYDARPGDIYLLCSDGLNDMVSDEEIHQILRRRPDDLAMAADRLVWAANEHGGRDNVSVILIRVLRAFPEEPGQTGSQG